MNVYKIDHQNSRIGKNDAGIIIYIRGFLRDLKCTCRHHKSADVNIQTTADLHAYRRNDIVYPCMLDLIDIDPVQSRRRIAFSRALIVKHIQFGYVQLEYCRQPVYTHRTDMCRHAQPPANTSIRVFRYYRQVQTCPANAKPYRIARIKPRYIPFAIICEIAADTDKEIQVAKSKQLQCSAA